MRIDETKFGVLNTGFDDNCSFPSDTGSEFFMFNFCDIAENPIRSYNNCANRAS